MKKAISILLLGVCLLLAGCGETEAPSQTRPQEPEPTAVYDWMAGESPVPVKRMGMYRYGLIRSPHTVSASGTYFLEESPTSDDSYILYADHGSDALFKLCSRADCTHNNSDCNAYVFAGGNLAYYNGYLYAISGEVSEESCGLIRMDPDGSNHKVALDLLRFVKECGGDFVNNSFITNGVYIFNAYRWEEKPDGSVDSVQIGTYYYKLDGSMDKPERQEAGTVLYSCGDVFLSFSPGDAQNGGESGSYWSWDPDTDTLAYLMDHPGQPGYFDEDEGFFFRDGAIWRKTYADQKETPMVDTGLQGDYILYVYPDCLLLVSREDVDHKLYIYNWNFELVDAVALNYQFNCRPHYLLVAETAERIILTDQYKGSPKYYINKSELGTGNVEIHAFKRTDH